MIGNGHLAASLQAMAQREYVIPGYTGEEIAYIVVVHLAPHHDSELAAILGRETRSTRPGICALMLAGIK